MLLGYVFSHTHVLVQVQPIHSCCFSFNNMSIACESQIPQDTKTLYKYSNFLRNSLGLSN